MIGRGTLPGGRLRWTLHKRNAWLERGIAQTFWFACPLLPVRRSPTSPFIHAPSAWTQH